MVSHLRSLIILMRLWRSPDPRSIRYHCGPVVKTFASGGKVSLRRRFGPQSGQKLEWHLQSSDVVTPMWYSHITLTVYPVGADAPPLSSYASHSRATCQQPWTTRNFDAWGGGESCGEACPDQWSTVVNLASGGKVPSSKGSNPAPVGAEVLLKVYLGSHLIGQQVQTLRHILHTVLQSAFQ